MSCKQMLKRDGAFKHAYDMLLRIESLPEDAFYIRGTAISELIEYLDALSLYVDKEDIEAYKKCIHALFGA